MPRGQLAHGMRETFGNGVHRFTRAVLSAAAIAAAWSIVFFRAISPAASTRNRRFDLPPRSAIGSLSFDETIPFFSSRSRDVWIAPRETILRPLSFSTSSWIVAPYARSLPSLATARTTHPSNRFRISVLGSYDIASSYTVGQIASSSFQVVNEEDTETIEGGPRHSGNDDRRWSAWTATLEGLSLGSSYSEPRIPVAGARGRFYARGLFQARSTRICIPCFGRSVIRA